MRFHGYCCLSEESKDKYSDTLSCIRKIQWSWIPKICYFLLNLMNTLYISLLIYLFVSKIIFLCSTTWYNKIIIVRRVWEEHNERRSTKMILSLKIGLFTYLFIFGLPIEKCISVYVVEVLVIMVLWREKEFCEDADRQHIRCYSQMSNRHTLWKQNHKALNLFQRSPAHKLFPASICLCLTIIIIIIADS